MAAHLELAVAGTPGGPGPRLGAQTGLQRFGHAEGGPHPGSAHRPTRCADRAAWVALPRAGEGQEDAAAVAEALSTAFMVLPAEGVADLCGRWPGLEAWLLREPPEEGIPTPSLIRLAGPRERESTSS